VRVAILGSGAPGADRIAAALVQGGLTLAAPDAPADLIITLCDPRQRLAVGDLLIDLALGRAAIGGRALPLTRIEFAILACLAEQQQPVGRDALLRAVWGYRFDPGTNLVAVHIFRLRAKIGGDRLTGGPQGYALVR
jgi:two-component system OmpR family response regulator